MYVGAQSTTGLGVLPLAPVVGIISSIFGGNSKDPGRLRTNAERYAEYTQSCNVSALNFLKGMSKRYGVVKDSQYCGGEGCTGWATTKARDDAYKKYQAASSGSYCKAGAAAAPGTIVAPNAGIPMGSGVQAANILGMNAPALAISAAAVIGIILLSRR
jgi:hypothetical protein